MKKLMCAIAAVSAGICLADVTSANIVGYSTSDNIQASSGERLYNMLSIPFDGVADGKGIFLKDLNFTEAKYSSFATSADQIKLWVPDNEGIYNYETWYLKSAGNWAKVGASTVSFESLHPTGVPAGTAFWYISTKRATPGTLTVSGAVCGDAFVTKTISRDQYNFVSFPYPVKFKPMDATQVNWGNIKSSSFASSADQIKIWVKDPESGVYNYETWYWKNATQLAKVGASTTYFNVAHPDGLDVGSGFWYIAKAKSGEGDTFDVTFYSPLEK